MLNALKQLIGLTPRDKREVWHEKPLVIVDEGDAVVFSGLATIEYAPRPDQYERGHANVFDEANGALVMSADIVRQQVYSRLDASNLFWLRWTRLGITAKAVDDSGRQLTFFIGRHAQSYLLRRSGSLLDYTADVTMTFPEDSESS